MKIPVRWFMSDNKSNRNSSILPVLSSKLLEMQLSLEKDASRTEPGLK